MLVSKIVDAQKKWAVETIKTGKLHGWTTEAKAAAQMRYLYYLEGRRKYQ
jgi:hypothetical protein